MSRTHVTLLGVVVDGPPENVDLSVYDGNEMTLRLDDALALHLGQAPEETLRAIGAAFYEAADEKAEAAIVALNTPSLPRVPASLHPVGPDYGTGAA
ncbi:hypothetical protein [Streptomyces sp. NBC_01794]|uniref:hypothetical protein n=1 Tax=Streptomyces sp. NBC_01794 TaxID=2975942 RepID=UPI00309131DA|nr:hypothetical protein OIE54_12280 [Streptomyces sp. NBC_01794]